MFRVSPIARLLGLAAAASALTMLAGCAQAAPAASDSAAGPVSVVASTDVYGNIASAIGGRAVRVTSIIDDPSKDPHDYEATVRDRLAVSRARIVIVNGAGYDDFMTTLLKADAGSHATVLNAATISGKKDVDAPSFNPHLWYDFPTVRAVVGRLSAALAEADPAHSADFARNRARFLGRLDALARTEAGIKTRHAGQPVAMTEPVPGYLLAACGLVDKTPPAFSHAVQEGTDVAPEALQQMFDLFTGHRIRLLAYNDQAPSPQADQAVAVARANGIPVVTVSETLPKNTDYLTWMSDNLAHVEAALER